MLCLDAKLSDARVDNKIRTRFIIYYQKRFTSEVHLCVVISQHKLTWQCSIVSRQNGCYVLIAVVLRESEFW